MGHDGERKEGEEGNHARILAAASGVRGESAGSLCGPPGLGVGEVLGDAGLQGG